MTHNEEEKINQNQSFVHKAIKRVIVTSAFHVFKKQEGRCKAEIREEDPSWTLEMKTTPSQIENTLDGTKGRWHGRLVNSKQAVETIHREERNK